VLADLLNKLSRSKPVLSESLNVGNGGAANALFQEEGTITTTINGEGFSS